MIIFAINSLLTVVYGSLVGFTAWRIASKSATKDALTTKWMVFLLACFFLSGLIFAILASLHWFNKIGCLVALLLLAGLAMSRTSKAAKNEKYPTAKKFHEFKYLQLPGLIVASIFAIRFCRGLVAPPLAWDALTYHLLKAGRWVQAGGWVADNAPDSWQFYKWFSPLGDIYWAWAMLGTHTDAWLAVAGGLIWAACGMTIYTLSVIFGAERRTARMAAATVLSVPAVMALLTAYYIESSILALVTAGSALLVHAARTRNSKLGGTALVAMALGAGMKITILPYLLVAGLVLLLILTVNKSGWMHGIWAGVLATIALSWQVFLIYNGKTPFYPAPFKLLGYSLEDGQPEFIRALYTNKHAMPYLWKLPGQIWIFLTGASAQAPNHLNFTWTFPLVVWLGCWGGYTIWRRSDWLCRVTLGGLFAAGLVLFIGFWSPATTQYRDIWADSMGRFMLPWYSLLVVLGLFAPWRYKNSAYQLIIAINCWYSWPRSWVWLDWKAVLIGFGISILIMASIWCIFQNTKWRWYWRMSGIFIFLGSAVGLKTVRDTFRYEFYKNTDKVYDVAFLGGPKFPGTAAEILDNSIPVTIDFTSDYGGVGYRWFRYIYMGSHLQNNVLYVSPTSDNSVWSKSVIKFKPVNYDMWRKRLKRQGVDYIVTIKPFASELDWLPEHQDTFSLLACEPQNEWAIYKVRN